jgi:hypothetical protein
MEDLSVKANEKIVVAKEMSNTFESQKSSRFVLRIKSAAGDCLIPPYLIKKVKFCPMQRMPSIWFEMYVAENCNLQDYIDITAVEGGVTAEITLLNKLGNVNNVVVIDGLKLFLYPFDLDYCDESRLILQFQSSYEIPHVTVN